MTLPIAILAGGLATRLLPVTSQIPKSLVEVAGRPFAEHQIDLLRRNGITNIVFLVGHLGEMVRDTLGDGSRWGVQLQYVFDGPRPLGTAGSLAAAVPYLGDRFFVLYGDSYLECDYAAVERTFLTSGKAGLMTVCRNDNRWDRSNVLFADNRIVSYNKDRQTDQMHHIDYGLGALSSAVLERNAPPSDLASVYQELLASDDLAAFEVPGRFYEIGSHEGLAETRSYLSSRRDRDAR
jgi:NDP-sugar pyrophosphorylase family protein